MTTTLLKADTKLHAITTAEFAARTWRWHSDAECSSRCVFCGIWVHAFRLQIGGEAERVESALVGSMLQHLKDEH